MSDQRTIPAAALTRRALIQNTAALAGTGLAGGLAFLPATAEACHLYQSPVDSKVGCAAFNRDKAAGLFDKYGYPPKLPAGGTAGSASTGGTSGGGSTKPVASSPVPSVGGNPTLPYSGQYLGCHVFSGGLGNNRYWDKHAYRFRCEYTGAVKAVRWENRYGSSSYSTGQGGRISVQIQSDSNGYPSGEVLGSTSIVTAPVKLGSYPLLSFQQPVSLTYGRIYHIVFIQHAPNEGVISVNDLYCASRPPDGLTIYPYWSDSLASIVRQNGKWQVRPSHIPMFGLHYADGKVKGQGIIAGGRQYSQPVQGSQTARQSFRISGPSVRVTEISCMVYRQGGAGDLDVQITDSSGRTVARETVPSGKVSVASYADAGARWVRVPLSSQASLASGGLYWVRLSAPGGSSYRVMPVKSGYAYDFRDDKVLAISTSSSQYSTNGGSSWTYWPVSYGGGYNRFYVLPVLLRLA